MSNRTSKLDGVHPALVSHILQVIDEMKLETGHTMIVTDGIRTAKEQYALWLKGRNEKGIIVAPKKVVTYADGYKSLSNHQIKASGFGQAVDCCFIINGRASWDETLPWEKYGELAKKRGLEWGGDWPGKKIDKPHVELQ